MSVKASSAVWENSKASGTLLLLQLALADNSNDSGLCWPGIDHLARKTRMSRRSVVTLIHQLEDLGEVVIRKNEGPKGTNLYLLPMMTRGETLAHLMQLSAPHVGVQLSAPPVQDLHQQVQLSAPVQGGGGANCTGQVAPEPSGTIATTTTEGGGEIVAPQKGVEEDFPEVVVPSEAELIKIGEAYAGNMAKAIPPGIPERWCSNYWSWRTHRLKDWKGDWKKEMVWRFERNYQDGDPRTRPPRPESPASASAGGTNGMWALKQKSDALRARIDGHPANENSSAWFGEPTAEQAHELELLQGQLQDCERLLSAGGQHE